MAIVCYPNPETGKVSYCEDDVTGEMVPIEISGARIVDDQPNAGVVIAAISIVTLLTVYAFFDASK